MGTVPVKSAQRAAGRGRIVCGGAGTHRVRRGGDASCAAGRGRIVCGGAGTHRVRPNCLACGGTGRVTPQRAAAVHEQRADPRTYSRKILAAMRARRLAY